VVDDADEVAIAVQTPAEPVTEPIPASQPLSQPKLVFGAGGRQVHAGPDETVDGHGFGRVVLPPQDGKANGAARPAPSHHPLQEKDEDNGAKAPPVPRPRLLIGQLRSG
jgi:hypothetical protein